MGRRVGGSATLRSIVFSLNPSGNSLWSEHTDVYADGRGGGWGLPRNRSACGKREGGSCHARGWEWNGPGRGLPQAGVGRDTGEGGLWNGPGRGLPRPWLGRGKGKGGSWNGVVLVVARGWEACCTGHARLETGGSTATADLGSRRQHGLRPRILERARRTKACCSRGCDGRATLTEPRPPPRPGRSAERGAPS